MPTAPHLLLIDGVRLLLVIECGAEVSHATLSPSDQVVAHSHLQTLGSVELDVVRERFLQEPQ